MGSMPEKRSENSTPFVGLPEHGRARQLDPCLPSQEFEQNHDSLLRRHDARDHGLQSVESAAGNMNRFARLQCRFHHVHLFCADGLSQLRNDAIRNCRPLIPKVNDPMHASGVMQLTGARTQFESSK